MFRGMGMAVAGVGVLAIAVLAALYVDERTDHITPVKHVTNEELRTIKPDFPGNAVDQRDRFFKEDDPYLPSMLSVLKWKLGGNRLQEAKENDTWRPEVLDPQIFLSSGKDGIMWLGHASFYIRIGGVNVLTDPVFGDPSFLPRIVAVPSPISLIGAVDQVLISHDHRDHMDESSIRAIAKKFPTATFIAGLRSEDLLKGWTTPTNRIVTAGWFQQVETGDPRVKIYFLPARHWSRRSLLDTNYRLWGSYIIQIGDKTIYFGGDTGYSEHFREIGELFPKIDIFIVGIGAYEPRWIMEPNHQDPEEAVRAFIDAKGGLLIPMHYGTFDLTDEPPSWPLKQLTEAAGKAGVSERIRSLAINEALLIDN